jgi:hypothetical protein
MAQIPAWRRYARFFGVDVSSDVDDELRFHLRRAHQPHSRFAATDRVSVGGKLAAKPYEMALVRSGR